MENLSLKNFLFNVIFLDLIFCYLLFKNARFDLHSSKKINVIDVINITKCLSEVTKTPGKEDPSSIWLLLFFITNFLQYLRGKELTCWSDVIINQFNIVILLFVILFLFSL